ncbi:hypothetical protein [Demequina subtropica]|uniref:hypothetical protein n=1 Tax=Demequina subtropica TaxID=1638989 RepID=UPI000780F061|nr:hypothetical protein [Demequina subtropica]
MVLAAAAAAFTGTLIDFDLHLGDDAPTASATILETGTLLGASWATIEFTTQDGRAVTTSSIDVAGRPEAGSTVLVRYSSEDPAYYVRGDALGTVGSDTIAFAAIAVALFALGLVLRRRRRRGKPRRGFRAWWTSQQGAATCGLVVALLCGTIATAGIDSMAHLDADDPLAEATVTDRWWAGRGGDHIEFVFETESGQVVIGQSSAGGREIGDTFAVRYDPDDPAYYYGPADGDGADAVLVWGMGIVAVLALVYAALGLAGRLPGWALNRWTLDA